MAGCLGLHLNEDHKVFRAHLGIRASHRGKDSETSSHLSVGQSVACRQANTLASGNFFFRREKLWARSWSLSCWPGQVWPWQRHGSLLSPLGAAFLKALGRMEELKEAVGNGEDAFGVLGINPRASYIPEECSEGEAHPQISRKQNHFGFYER